MMKTSKLKNTVFTILALCIGLTSRGQERSDSLLSYLEIAARNNPTILQRYAEYEAALQKVPQVGSLPDPELSLGVFLSPMELIGGKQVADIRLMQMFPWFGVLKAGKDEMSLMAKAKFEIFRDAKLQVFYDVQRNWYELNKVSENIRVSEKNLELLRVIERLAIVRLKSGTIISTQDSKIKTMTQNPASASGQGASGMNGMGGNTDNVSVQVPMPGNSMGSSAGGSGLSDVYRIQIEMGELQNEIDQLKDMRNTITVRFNGILNRSPEAEVAVPDTLYPEIFLLETVSIADSVLQNTPMVEMISLENQSLDARKIMVSRMGYPMIGIGVNYSVIAPSDMSTTPMNGNDMIMPMVTATIPIYRKKYKAMKKEADYLKTANEQNFKATINSLQTDYYEAIQQYQDSQRRIALYTDQYELASKSMQIMLKSFASSGAGLTDILRVQQQLLDYGYQKAEAVSDFNTSIARIKRLTAME